LFILLSVVVVVCVQRKSLASRLVLKRQQTLSAKNSELKNDIQRNFTLKLITIGNIRMAYTPNNNNSYEALAKDDNVDVIYVGTPHSFHFDNAMMCLDNGKHLVIEKPVCVNAKQAEKLFKAAREKQLFVLEGMWTRFFPCTDKLRQLLFEEKAIGDVCAFHGTFGFADDGSAPRLTRMDCAGGALLDIGVYLTAMASLAFGGFHNEFPKLLHSSTIKGVSGCDNLTSTSFTLSDGRRMGSYTCSIQCPLPNTITIVGEKGNVVIDAPFHAPSSLTLAVGRAAPQRFEFAPLDNADKRKFNFGGSIGFVHEIRHVEQCLANKNVESLLMPTNESLAITKFMDQVRKQIDLVYEQD
jgi:dihydrodiol dehydrogenase / D-xylose 1-dehydrogenase (NADP)